MSSPKITVSLDHGLRVLRAFRAESAPLSNAELVKRTGLSRSSVSRLTRTLVNLGYLRRVSGGGLSLTVHGLDIGYAYTQVNPVTTRVSPLLQDLADRLDAIVALAVPDGLDMLYIACRASSSISTLRLGVGSLLPMGITSIGRAWLWALPPHERQRYLDAIAASAGARADALRHRIERAFDELDATGVCLSVGEYQQDAYGIALPLRVGRSRTLMAMNCGAVGVNLDFGAIRDRVAPELQHAARQIESMLHDVDAEP